MDEILAIANPTIKEVLTKKILNNPSLGDADAVADTLSFKTLKEVAQMRESRPKFAGATLADSSDMFYMEGPNEAIFEISDTIVGDGKVPVDVPVNPDDPAPGGST